MKLAIALLAATTMGISAAAAQGDKAGLYLNQDDQGMYRVYGGDNMQGSELLMNENGAAPAVCPEGSFYETSDHFIRECGTDAQFGVSPVEEGAMMASGEPYREGSWLLDREGVAFGGEDEQGDTGVDAESN